jgi:uncharacterized protein YlxW (UPF0749 family)
MTDFIAIALKHWKWFAIGALVLFLGVQSARLANAKRDQINPATKEKWKVEAVRDAKALKQAQTDLGQCRANVGTLKASIASQNAAVDAWRAEADARTAAASKAAQDARSARAVAESRAQQLANLQSAATCPEREAAISDLVKGLTR